MNQSQYCTLSSRTRVGQVSLSAMLWSCWADARWFASPVQQHAVRHGIPPESEHQSRKSLIRCGDTWRAVPKGKDEDSSFFLHCESWIKCEVKLMKLVSVHWDPSFLSSTSHYLLYYFLVLPVLYSVIIGRTMKGHIFESLSLELVSVYHSSLFFSFLSRHSLQFFSFFAFCTLWTLS